MTSKPPIRPLGTTGVEVSALSYGAMELRGLPRGRDLAESEVGHLLNTVLDSGVTLIDTSIDYEASEERIGRHIGHRRSEFLLASKCGCLVGWERPADYQGGMRGGGPHDFSRANIIAGVEQSLRRLRTDHLDLLQVHASPDAATLVEHDVVGTMNELRAQGKVGLIGMSGTLPALTQHIEMGVFDVFQIPYSAVQREHEAAIAQASNGGAGVLARGGAGRGVAAGNARTVPRNPKLVDAWTRSEVEDILDDMTPMEFTLRFTLSHPGVSSVLAGTANLDHFIANVEAIAKGPLPDDLLALAKTRLGTGS
ncbi:MAG TPA: aldo/keto reductase [Acidimicrobiia bacterium]|jgi:aryl-alcohol dehydrogenase-like predicted oxidoreductase